MPWLDEKIHDLIAAVSRGFATARFGPGVLGTIVPIASVGVIALAGVAYALSASPVIALAAIALILVFLAYVVHLAFRYAEKDPVSALLGGTQLLQLVRQQMSARDKALVVESKPEPGKGIAAIEHKDGSDV